MKCKLEGMTVHYEAFGEGKPIIMLHGWPLDHRIMVHTMEPIFKNRDGWKRIYPDLPGMGKTPGVDWITSQDQVLDIILEFAEGVAPGQRLVIAGFSYGGYLARGVVFRRSAILDGLLLIAPVLLTDDTRQTIPVHTTLVKDHALISELESDIAEAFEGFAVVQSRELLESMKAVGIPPRKIADYEFLDRLYENYAFSFDVDKPPEPLAGPTLMIMGRQDSSCGYYDAWSILDNFSRGTFVVLDRAGHGLMIEQPRIFNALVNEWIDRVEENAQAA
jgi:pimeloyl-ACP methyl ester carboxylesterase